MSTSMSRNIVNTHKDNLLNLNKLLTKKQMQLQSMNFANERYLTIQAQINDLRYELQICEEDLFNHLGSLSVIEDKYQELKEKLKVDLENRLTETINSWYNENVRLKFKYSGTSTKDKRKAVKLLDINKGVRLKEVTGDAACQTVGLLVAICIAKMRGLKFLFLDEPFSNFNDISAQKVPDLLNNIIDDMQIVIVENKGTVLRNLKGYTYRLDKESYILSDENGNPILDEEGNEQIIHKSIIDGIENEDLFIPLVQQSSQEETDDISSCDQEDSTSAEITDN